MSRKTVNRVRLNNLYQSEDTYNKVYKFMESIFEEKFKFLLNKVKGSYLEEPTLLMEEKIKRYFIELVIISTQK